MKRGKIWFLAPALGVAFVLGGCASSTAEKQRAADIASCPARPTQNIMSARRMIESIEPGKTKSRWLKKGPAPVKTMALTRAQEPALTVLFYKTSLPGCTWLAAESSHVPVIAQSGRKGLVLGYGRDTLRALQNQGWVLSYRTTRWGKTTYTPTPWAWQTWDYDYLPKN